MFQLSAEEFADLKSQSVISSGEHGGRRKRPLVFTGSYAALQERLGEIEREMTARLDQHDEQLEQIFRVLRQLIGPPQRPKKPVGFRIREP